MDKPLAGDFGRARVTEEEIRNVVQDAAEVLGKLASIRARLLADYHLIDGYMKRMEGAVRLAELAEGTKIADRDSP